MHKNRPYTQCMSRLLLPTVVEGLAVGVFTHGSFHRASRYCTHHTNGKGAQLAAHIRSGYRMHHLCHKKIASIQNYIITLPSAI